MEYLKPFLIGGGVIAGSKYVSKFAGPEYGAIIGGMPTGIIASFFLHNKKDVKTYYQGYAYHAVVLALTIIIIHHMLDNYKYDEHIVSIVGMVVWAVMSFLISKYYLH